LRFLLLYKQGSREMKRLIHPQEVSVIKLGKQVLPPQIIDAVWGFIAMYLVVFVVLLMCLIACGLDLDSSFGALAGCISNAGAGIGKVVAGFGVLNTPSKWTLMVAMLAGRLEIFTLLILFMPSFWRS
jgi:trk system potassium uptake protein TrkH